MISASSAFINEESRLTGAHPTIRVTLGGNHVVPERYIIDPGEMSFARAYDFGDLASGDYTFMLDGEDGKYCPGHEDFISTTDNWYKMRAKVEFGYKKADRPPADWITLFEGYVTEWNVIQAKGPEFDSPYEGVVAELTCRDKMSLLENRRVGQPADDGDPKPLIYGTVFWDAEDLNDKRLWNPDTTCDFEEGNFSEFEAVIENGTGDVSIITSNPYEGTYCAKCKVDTSDDDAYLKWSFGAGVEKTYCLITFYIKFVTIPVSINNHHMRFFELRNESGSGIVKMDAYSDGYVRITDAGGDWKETDWYMEEYQGTWRRVTVGCGGTGDNEITKVWVDGDEVYSNTRSTGYKAHEFFLGLYPQESANEIWEIHLDQVMIDDIYFSLGVYLPGAPFTSIDKVWVDGRVLNRLERTYEARRKRLLKRWEKYKRKHPAGKRFAFNTYDDYKTWGLVDFIDKENPPSGSYMIEATKNTTKHPADVIKALLTECGLSSHLNTGSFTTVKSAEPNYYLGAYLDDFDLPDAIGDICKRVCYDLLWLNSGITLKRYTGSPLTSSVLTLDKDNCSSFEQYFDCEDVRSSITTKWGFQSKYTENFYRKKSTALEALYGTNSEEIDLSYGQEIHSDDGVMAKAKTDLLFKRLGGPREIITAVGDLSLARVELGDGVEIDNTDINETKKKYEVFEKTVNLADMTVELVVVRFMGEGSY